MQTWSLVIGIAGVIISVLTIILSLRQRSRKSMSYEVISDLPLVTVSHDAKNNVSEAIEVLYKGRPVKEVRLVTVRFWNSGNVPIVPDDYVKPIELVYGGDLLASDVIATIPTGQRDLIAGGGIGPGFSAVGFRHILLNPNDSVTVQAVLTNFHGDVRLDGHIVGVPTESIRRVDKVRTTSGVGVYVTLGIAALLFGSAALLINKAGYQYEWAAIVATALASVGITLLAGALIVVLPRITRDFISSYRQEVDRIKSDNG